MSAQNSPPPRFNGDNDNAAIPAYAFNTKIMVGAIILLFGVICFILMLHVYAKWFLRRSSPIHLRSQGRVAPSAQRSAGLDKASILQLPTFVYTATASPVDTSDEPGKLHQSSVIPMPAPECAVCLSEFQENEKGRMLPSCKHMFHTECIDMWLFSHSTCPLCRTNVAPPTTTSTETIQTAQQHPEQEAMEPSEENTEATSASTSLHAVEYPCNVLFWGNETQVIATQESPTSSRVAAGARPLPQITIDIPPREGNLLVSAYGGLSAKHTVDQEAGSSHPMKSPSLRTSIKRMLSKQSSRHKSPRQEGNEEISPK